MKDKYYYCSEIIKKRDSITNELNKLHLLNTLLQLINLDDKEFDNELKILLEKLINYEFK